MPSFFSQGKSNAERAPSADAAVLDARIRSMLDRRKTLVPALLAFADELPAGQTRRNLRKLARCLRECSTVDQFWDSSAPITDWLPLLSAADLSSPPVDRVREMFHESTRESRLRRERLRSVAYPLMVMLLAGVVLAFLCVTLVPTFTDIFDDFQLDLPAMTNALVKLSQWPVRQCLAIGLLALVAILACGGVFWRIRKRWSFPGKLFGFMTAGSSQHLSIIAKFSRQLADLVAMGLTLPTALRLAARDCQSAYYRDVVETLAREIGRGDAAALRSSARRLPSNLVYALQAGENNQPSVALLQELADLYGDRLRDRFDWSTGVLAQGAIVAVGLVVAFVVIALFLPLVELINGLTG